MLYVIFSLGIRGPLQAVFQFRLNVNFGRNTIPTPYKPVCRRLL